MKQPKYVLAGKMRENGASYDEIAKEFGWKRGSAEMAVWRYRNRWEWLATHRNYEREAYHRRKQQRETGK